MATNTTFSWRGVGIASTNLALSVLFCAFAYSHLQQFLIQPRLSLLLIVVVEALVAVLVIIRRDPDRTDFHWMTWIATIGGTVGPLLLRPTDATVDLFAGQLLQLAGVVLQIYAVMSLNRSFGLLPAHRGVKSDGMYRWVRHPLYSSYLLAHAGYLVNNFSWANVGVILLATAFQVWRILQEESLLGRYEAYASYQTRTRWRLIPAIW